MILGAARLRVDAAALKLSVAQREPIAQRRKQSVIFSALLWQAAPLGIALTVQAGPKRSAEGLSPLPVPRDREARPCSARGQVARLSPCVRSPSLNPGDGRASRSVRLNTRPQGPVWKRLFGAAPLVGGVGSPRRPSVSLPHYVGAALGEP